MGRRPDLAEPERTPVSSEIEPVKPARSGPRQSVGSALAEPWREVLLRLSTSLPIDVTAEELGRIFLDGVEVLFPSSALALRWLESGRPEPRVLYRLSEDTPPGPAPAGPRSFPSYAEERIYELADGGAGATFHVARETASEVRVPFDAELGEQAAMVVGAALVRLRVYARAAESMHDFDRLQAQVMQTEKLASLGQLVAGVVHELNNPLTSIIAYSDYLTRKLAQESAGEPEDVERLRRIGEAAARILKFSRDLVTYARPSGDERTLVQLVAIVERALSFCEHEFVENGVEVEQCSDASLPSALCVPGQLTQVFVNLFTNAAHAMGGGGTLRVDVRATDGGTWLEVVITDTGDGIPPEVMPQIFEPFFTTKTDGRGTGLGLSIVRGILDAHGGTIRVKSTRGRGTSFELRLPTAS